MDGSGAGTLNDLCLPGDLLPSTENQRWKGSRYLETYFDKALTGGYQHPPVFLAPTRIAHHQGTLARHRAVAETRKVQRELKRESGTHAA